MPWRYRQALRVVDGFIAALNAHDADAAAQSLHPDFTYTDSLGGSIRGRADCTLALQRFVLVDDLFAIHIDKKTVTLPEVLLTGYTAAREPRFARKMLWRAEVKDGLLRAWQSFGTNNPPAWSRILMEDRPVYGGGSFTSLIETVP